MTNHKPNAYFAFLKLLKYEICIAFYDPMACKSLSSNFNVNEQLTNFKTQPLFIFIVVFQRSFIIKKYVM